MQVVDDIRLGRAYAPGILKDIRTSESDELSFDFGGARWRLSISERPRYRWSRPHGAREILKLPFGRYLKLTRE
jgi:hypothetical protein